jgi:hypothetical protein
MAIEIKLIYQASGPGAGLHVDQAVFIHYQSMDAKECKDCRDSASSEPTDASLDEDPTGDMIRCRGLQWHGAESHLPHDLWTCVFGGHSWLASSLSLSPCLFVGCKPL